MTTMQIYINSKPYEIQPNTPLIEVLSGKFKLDKIAVEIDKNIIPKSSWKEYILQDQSKIEVVEFVAGG